MAKTHADQEDSIAATLNRDLLVRLSEIDAGAYTSSECWSSSMPLVRETCYWIAFSAAVWIVAVLLIK